MAKTIHQNALPDGKVWATPTKSFFVSMLTRDIELMDAIMDLIDNCIDGVHRQLKKNKKNSHEFLYKGYYAEIKLSEKEFKLKDNCGGIPLDVARQYAFKMGRSEEYHDDDKLETLGMYGIGMKRAIFKMGLKSDVTTWHDKNIFRVTIPEDWSDVPEWMFDYKILKKADLKNLLNESGTVVQITKLHKNISKQFNDDSGFVKDLKIALKNHYGYIIKQGFRISVNGVKIEPIELNILTADPKIKTPKSIKPYVYKSKMDDVDIEIIVGFYRPLASEEEIQQELDGGFAASQSENAGVTILCNDRVVLYCDKTFLTGWGEPPVPKYHTQFIAIAGVVHFRSSTPINLPVTTTKRGLDTSSAIYATAKIKIKEGLRHFTAFTNNWKSPSVERTQLFKSAKKINALKPGQSSSPFIKLTLKRGDDAKYQIPDLPKPNDAISSRFVTISFSKEKEKVEAIKNYFLDGTRASAAEVGAWCFDKIYSQVE
jgi:hypothetical protein